MTMRRERNMGRMGERIAGVYESAVTVAVMP
jgi:hypothetical protein